MLCALCPMLKLLNSMLYALCSVIYAPSSMLYALCLCSMPYAYVLCHMLCVSLAPHFYRLKAGAMPP